MLYDPEGDMSAKFGPPPRDPESGMLQAAYKIVSIVELLREGRFADEGLTHTERRRLLGAADTTLKAFHDVMELLRQSADPLTQAAFGRLMFSLETSIDAVLVVDYAERDAHQGLLKSDDAP